MGRLLLCGFLGGDGVRAGRKGKYEKWLTDEGLVVVEGWARAGLSDEQVAKNLGIATGTIYEWKNRFPEFAEALKKGKEVVDFEVENALFRSAVGYTVTENGKERYVPPNPTAIIFWLKNRKGDVWRDRRDVDVQACVRGNPFANLTEEELKGLASDG